MKPAPAASAPAPWTLTALIALASCAAPPAPPPSALPPPIAIRPLERVDDQAFAFQGALMQGGYAIGQAPQGTLSVSLDGRPLTLAANGRFAIGFSRDAPAHAVVEAAMDDGSRLIARIAVGQRNYEVQSIPGLPGKSAPDPEYERLRAGELARIATARTQRNTSDGWQQRWIWPVIGRISGVYGSQRVLGGVPHSPHNGVDIAAPSGTPIVAPADGVVVLAGPPQFSLEGNLVIIDHGMGVNSAYLHLSRVDVRPGDRVRRGQCIGAVGTTGRSTGPHLHWGLNWLDQRLDPALLPGPMPGATATGSDG